MDVIDLFSGAGGISWGLHKAGFNIIGAIDVWDKALVTFQRNHPSARIFAGDIRSLQAPDIRDQLRLKRGQLDVMAGGPPCQGFSKNVPASYRFLEDPKNQLFRDFLRFVDEFRPKIVLMENVAEIYNAFGGQVREEITTQLTQMGYSVNVQVLFAPDYGVPQRRRRAFFLGCLAATAPAFPQPMFSPQRESLLYGDLNQYRSAWDAISDLPTLKNGEGFEPMDYTQSPRNEYQRSMRRNSTRLFDHIAKNLKPKQLQRIMALEPGQGHKQLPEELKPKSGYSGAYARLDFDMLAPTITRWVFHPGSGRFSHPKDHRLITIREAARLQGFSDDFRFYGSYTEKAFQVGNAVPPIFSEALSTEISRLLAS